MVEIHKDWINDIQDKFSGQSYKPRGGLYHPILMNKLPKGLDQEAWVSFNMKEAADEAQPVENPSG